MFKKTTSSSDKTGLENNTEPVCPKMVETRPSVFKIPKNIFLLAETRSARGRFYEAIEEVEHLLRILINKPINPYFKNKLCSQIDAGKTVLAEYQHKLNELVSICSDSCKGWWGTPWDIDELTEDLSAYKKKFNMVKEECMCFLPEGTPNMSSPPVAKSQPSTAEEEEVISSRTRTGSVPRMEETYNLANLFVSHQECQDIQKGAGIAPRLFTVVCHPEEHNMTPAMDGEEPLQEEEVISSRTRTGSVPSMEETYNLANLFVSHQESQDIQNGAGIAPRMFTVVCHPEEHNITPAMVNQAVDTVGFQAEAPEIEESFCVEAGVEETDEAVAGDTVTPAEDVVKELVTETRAAPGETERTKLGSDKSHPSALTPSRIILLMSSIMLVGHALGDLDGEVEGDNGMQDLSRPPQYDAVDLINVLMFIAHPPTEAPAIDKLLIIAGMPVLRVWRSAQSVVKRSLGVDHAAKPMEITVTATVWDVNQTVQAIAEPVVMFDVHINLEKVQEKIVKRGHCILLSFLTIYHQIIVRLPKHSNAVVFINKVIVILPLHPELWLDFTSNPPDQDSSLLGSHYSSLVCSKLYGGVMVSAVAKGQYPVVEERKKGKKVRFGIHLIAGRIPGHFHSFSELEAKFHLTH